MLPLAGATIFGNVRGIVHDPQHRPIEGAQVTIHASGSAWSRACLTDDSGEFAFTAVPLGDYNLTVNAQGFSELSQKFRVDSGSAPVLHFQLQIASTTQEVEVTGAPAMVNTQSSTTETIINQQEDRTHPRRRSHE